MLFRSIPYIASHSDGPSPSALPSPSQGIPRLALPAQPVTVNSTIAVTGSLPKDLLGRSGVSIRIDVRHADVTHEHVAGVEDGDDVDRLVVEGGEKLRKDQADVGARPQRSRQFMRHGLVPDPSSIHPRVRGRAAVGVASRAACRIAIAALVI